MTHDTTMADTADFNWSLTEFFRHLIADGWPDDRAYGEVSGRAWSIRRSMRTVSCAGT